MRIGKKRIPQVTETKMSRITKPSIFHMGATIKLFAIRNGKFTCWDYTQFLYVVYFVVKITKLEPKQTDPEVGETKEPIRIGKQQSLSCKKSISRQTLNLYNCNAKPIHTKRRKVSTEIRRVTSKINYSIITTSQLNCVAIYNNWLLSRFLALISYFNKINRSFIWNCKWIIFLEALLYSSTQSCANLQLKVLVILKNLKRYWIFFGNWTIC